MHSDRSNSITSIPAMNGITRVAICGAGPSGLSQLHAFELARRSGIEIPEIVCFEKQSDIGGQWNYTWRTGFDEFCEPVHSSMYQNLWTNLPKECLEFVDYTFDEHFGRPITSFPPRTVVADYIRAYARRNNILQYIQFNTVIRWVSFDDTRSKFTLLIKDLRKDETRSEEFDYVIIASGHFSTPNMPYVPGIETFPGRMFHSHDFRCAEDFLEKDVLLVGSGLSAEDIALQLYKYGVRSVTISFRTKPLNLQWPNEVKEVPLLLGIDRKTGYFIDGSSQEFDGIIFCTGYIHHFPFLDNNLRLRPTKNCLCPPDLYKTVFWVHQPRLIYLGMQCLTFGLNIGNAQAWFVRDVILGKLTLPQTKNEMLFDMAQWDQKARSIGCFKEYIYYQRDYVVHLMNLTEYPRFDIDKMVNILLECVASRFDNILTYRERTYPSAITSTMAVLHHTPWLEEMDDRMENFVKK